MVEVAAQYRAELARLDPTEVSAYLIHNSGLPGPRANLTLLDVAGELVPDSLIWTFLDESEEYLACCGVVGLGRLVLDCDDPGAMIARLKVAAADDRWRVREAAAIAMQRIGDTSPAMLRDIVATWADDADPLVVRAAIASICEPRLLTDPVTAAAALQACERATAALAAIPQSNRRQDAARVLRKGLAYCWSVAVAASPQQGLGRFFAIDTDDPDLAWVVKQNLAKQRMIKLL